jgi:hypothetical protein
MDGEQTSKKKQTNKQTNKRHISLSSVHAADLGPTPHVVSLITLVLHSPIICNPATSFSSNAHQEQRAIRQKPSTRPPQPGLGGHKKKRFEYIHAGKPSTGSVCL